MIQNIEEHKFRDSEKSIEDDLKLVAALADGYVMLMILTQRKMKCLKRYSIH